MRNRFALAAMIMALFKDDSGIHWDVYRELEKLLQDNGFTKTAHFLSRTTDAVDSRFYIKEELIEDLRVTFVNDLSKFTVNS